MIGGVRPVAVVVDDQRSASAAATLARLEGWDVCPDPSTIDARPRSRPSTRRIAVVADEPPGLALELALDGTDLIVVSADLPARFHDALSRLAEIVDARHVATYRLSVDQLELLDHLAQGASVDEAAAAKHLSARTAHRRLAEARTILGAETTMAALVAVRAATGWLRT